MRHRRRDLRALILPLAAVAAAAFPAGAAPAPAPAPGGVVSATVTGLRSAKGRIVACLTARPAAFPDCADDPAAIGREVPAAEGATLDFGHVAPGRYAISLFHDENGNGRLDKRMLLPREGYGFSRDAPVRFGPPSFAAAAFTVAGGDARQSIRMRYIF